MVCFQNSRSRSSTAREEPAAHRINDVNPRNGSATSLANSQFSPSPPGPPPCPALPYPPSSETPPSSLSLFLCLAEPFPLRCVPPLEPSLPLLFGSDPDTTRSPEGTTQPPDLQPSLFSASTPAFVARASLRAYNTTLFSPSYPSSSSRLHSLCTLLRRPHPASHPSRCPRSSCQSSSPCWSSEVTDSRAAVFLSGRTARKGPLRLFTHETARHIPSSFTSPTFSFHLISNGIGRPPW